jgi:hypothetical protein
MGCQLSRFCDCGRLSFDQQIDLWLRREQIGDATLRESLSNKSLEAIVRHVPIAIHAVGSELSIRELSDRLRTDLLRLTEPENFLVSRPSRGWFVFLHAKQHDSIDCRTYTSIQDALN